MIYKLFGIQRSREECEFARVLISLVFFCGTLGLTIIYGPFYQARPSREGFLAEMTKQSLLRNRKSRVWEAPQTLPLCSLSIRGTSGRQPNIIETVYDILKISHHGGHSPNPGRWSAEYGSRSLQKVDRNH